MRTVNFLSNLCHFIAE